MAEQSRTISLNVLARMEQFNREFRKKFPNATEAAAMAATKKMQSIFLKEERERLARQKKMATQIGGIYKTVIGAAAAGIATIMAKVSFDAIKAFTQNVADSRNQVGDLSAALGISSERLQAFDFAAKISGGDLKELEASLKGFPKRLDDFSRGSGEAKFALERLGITQEEVTEALAEGRDMTGKVIERLQSMENAQQRAAFSTAIFGEAGTRLTQVLGDRSLEDWIKLTSRYADKVGPEAIDRSQRWEAASAMLAGKLDELKGRVFDLMTEGGRLSTVFAGIAASFSFVAAAAEALSASWDNYVERQEARSRALAALLEGDFSKAWEEANSATTNYNEVLGILGNSVDRAREVYNEFKTDLEEITEIVKAQKDEVGQTSDEVTRSAKKAQEAAAARLAAEKELAGIFSTLTADQLEGLDAIRHKYEATNDRIFQLAAERLITEDEAIRALTALEERMHRDLVAENERAASKKAEATSKAYDRIRDIVNDATEDLLSDIGAVERGWAETMAEIDRMAADGLVSWRQAQEAKVAVTARAQREITDIEREENRQRIQNALDYVGQITTAMGDLANTLARIYEDRLKHELDANQTQVEKLREQREDLADRLREVDRRVTRDGIDRRLDRLDAEIKAAEEEKQLIRKKHMDAFVASKATAITTTTIAGVVAAMQALAQLGPVAGGIAAVAIGITTAANIAAIASEPPPQFFRGGGRMRRGEAPGEALALLHEGERVLNARAVRDLGDGVINAINQGFSGQAMGGITQVMIDGEDLADATARRMRRGGDIRTAAASAGKTGRRLVYRG